MEIKKFSNLNEDDEVNETYNSSTYVNVEYNVHTGLTLTAKNDGDEVSVSADVELEDIKRALDGETVTAEGTTQYPN